MKRQLGFALGYVLLSLALISVLAVTMQSLAGTSTRSSLLAQRQKSAAILIDGSDKLRNLLNARIADIESAAPYTANGWIYSATNQFERFEAPILARSESASGWTINSGDALIVPISEAPRRVAFADVSESICEFINLRLVDLDEPEVSTSANGNGGVDYYVTNPGFNSGRPADRFCARGVGQNGLARLIVGL